MTIRHLFLITVFAFIPALRAMTNDGAYTDTTTTTTSSGSYDDNGNVTK